MRRLLWTCSALLMLCAPGCAPTMRQILIEQTAQYTRCNVVEVDCVDDNCSNVAGGPWTATACATRYRCTNTNGQVVCTPQAS